MSLVVTHSGSLTIGQDALAGDDMIVWYGQNAAFAPLVGEPVYLKAGVNDTFTMNASIRADVPMNASVDATFHANASL